MSRRKPVGGSIDYQALDNITFNPEPLSTPAVGNKKILLPLSSERSLSDGDDVSYSQRKSAQISLPRSVSWGIHWKKPSFIGFMFFFGFALSLAHHFYYMSLSGKRTGDETKQAWPTRIGTGLAFLVTSCLKATTTAALGQYIWRVVKRQPLTMKNLDRLFALSTDPIALFSIELLKGAKLAILLGAITWLLGLASVAPAATLTVVARNITEEVRLPVLDFTKAIWNNSMDGEWDAVLVTNTIAINTASNNDVLELSRQVAGSEWSYSLQFYGPSIKCNEPNSTQQAVFNNITKYYEQQNIFTYTDQNDNRTNITFDVGSRKIIYASWSIWYASGTPNNVDSPRPLAEQVSPYPQLWIQTSTSELVCSAVNASFNIAVSYVDGVQHVTQQDIKIIGDYDLSYVSVGSIESGTTSTDSNGVTTMSAGGAMEEALWNEYIPHMYALGAILGGNITLQDITLTNDQNVREYSRYGATNVLGTGLMACEEIANTPFKNESSYLIHDPSATFSNTFTSTNQPWLCRNRTLARGIEDLANNITISYLSSPDLTRNGDPQTIVTSNTNNYYVYHPLWLLISYGLALLFSFIAVVVGVFAMHSNGVVHSNSFSAIVATTRNPELDECLGRSSLGAEPLQTDSEDRKLKFGPILDPTKTGDLKDISRDSEGQRGADEKIPHVAFGLVQSVGQLRKREMYI
ncbi:0a3e53ad-cc74-4819-a71a-6b31110dcbe1 [Sclerotinia trifoliorum]|uniref:0a3e53ad-cc74-4819-a71a-6b31110dcbe1 n=1 Tax=Sclerotinia trifoliorum TaxID=28548 RepID=A0A8H2VXN0_9HELO|nr:0a3e53ad-cc74-4819-a71a-6b31110dcbe1 [Sclerotinia trifoliorum]